MTSPIKLPPRIFFSNRGTAFLTWMWKHQTWTDHDSGDRWEMLEEWQVFVGLPEEGDEWFNVCSNAFEGHTCKYITIFGISIGKISTYESQLLPYVEVAAHGQ